MFPAHSAPLHIGPQAVAPKSGVALRLASTSQELMSLMAEHDIRSQFSAVGENGLCVVDATRNPTNAYKIRGALAGVAHAKVSGKGAVVTASAGNHGAGVACAAKALGLAARVYVPVTAPKAKVDKIEGFGATVVKVGNSFDEALRHAMLDERRQERQGTFVHPFNDIMVAAGQGTIGLEMLAHVEKLRKEHSFEHVRIFLPVGGGGLLAGVASAVKTLWDPAYPQPEIVGVIDESSPAALLGTLFGRPVAAAPDTIAQGAMVALVGEIFLSVSQLVDYIVLVRHDSIVSAMREYERSTFTQLEGAGALALAGEAQARRYELFERSSSTLSLALVSGRNVDPCSFHKAVTSDSRLDISSHTRRAFDVRVPEREGELLHFLRAVKNFNIASLTYKQRPGTDTGSLRVEFEVPRASVLDLHRAIENHFPGSCCLEEGEEMVYRVGQPVAAEYRETLLTLDDRPGSFLEYVERLSLSGFFGSVGFLFYRKPADVGRAAQVVLGLRQV